MHWLFDFIITLLLETAADVTDKPKTPLWVRIPALILLFVLFLLYVFILGGLGWLTLALFHRGLPAQGLFIGIAFLLVLIACLFYGRFFLRRLHRKKEEMRS